MTELLSTLDGSLQCPSCGDVNGLHVDEVIMAGDSGQGLALFAPDEDATDTNIPVAGIKIDRRSVSDRRHSVVLVIWCEVCGKWTRVTFIQHKGQTLVKTKVIG